MAAENVNLKISYVVIYVHECICHYTILNWLNSKCHMLVYIKQVLQTCEKQLDWAPAETPGKIAGLGTSRNILIGHQQKLFVRGQP